MIIIRSGRACSRIASPMSSAGHGNGAIDRNNIRTRNAPVSGFLTGADIFLLRGKVCDFGSFALIEN